MGASFFSFHTGCNDCGGLWTRMCITGMAKGSVGYARIRKRREKKTVG